MHRTSAMGRAADAPLWRWFLSAENKRFVVLTGSELNFRVFVSQQSQPGQSGSPKNSGRIIRVFKNATSCLSQNSII
jgi:hypothetical protein